MSEHTEQPAMEILRGSPTPEELAALIAVVSDAYTREAEDAVAEEPHVSAWQRTQRGLHIHDARCVVLLHILDGWCYRDRKRRNDRLALVSDLRTDRDWRI